MKISPQRSFLRGKRTNYILVLGSIGNRKRQQKEGIGRYVTRDNQKGSFKENTDGEGNLRIPL